MIQHSGKRVLVTGGAGFLGSHLCRRLLDLGNQVICLDNFYSGSRLNVTDLLANPLFELVRHDITFPYYCEVDEIYNLACPASPVHYQKDPVQTLKTCVHGAINVLGLAKRCGARIMQASTSEIYGDPNVSPQPECYWGNVNPIGIRSCYDEGKRAAETLFTDYKRQHNVDVRIARIFNTYGPAMAFNDGRVVSNFITQALLGLPVSIYGGGGQTRSFCYVSDLIEGIIALMNCESVDGPVNLGSDNEISVKELAENIIDLVGSKSVIEVQNLPEDDPKIRRPDLQKSRTILGWSAEVSLQTGLTRTIQDFKSRLLVNQ